MGISRNDIKLVIRYIIILYLIYLSYTITQPIWLLDNTKILSSASLSVIIGSVYGALALVLKSHFKYTISNDNVNNDKWYIKDIKLASRYIILIYFLYMLYIIIQPEWLHGIKDVNDNVIAVLVASIYASAVIVLGAHFEYKISDIDTNIPINN